jgi:hypothetical protein
MKPDYNQKLRTLLKELKLTQVAFSKTTALSLNKIKTWLAPTSSPRYKVMTSYEFYLAKEKLVHLIFSKRAQEKPLRLSASIDNAVFCFEQALELLGKGNLEDAKAELQASYETMMEAYYIKQAMGL